MRNLKKFLALVLAMMMVFSLMLTVNAADPAKPVGFEDLGKVNSAYAEAVNVLSALKVVQGDEDGFRPQDPINRAEVAAMIYRIATADTTATGKDIYKIYDQFDDVNSEDWFAGYVNFCGNAEYIKGTTPTTFNPGENVTGYEVLAMILRVVGYDRNGEFTGPTWSIQTAATARSLGILKNVKEGTLGSAATREMVAELLFQAMQVPTVKYNLLNNYTQDVLVTARSNGTGYVYDKTVYNTLMYSSFDIVGKRTIIVTDGTYGRPMQEWVKDSPNDTLENGGKYIVNPQAPGAVTANAANGVANGSAVAAAGDVYVPVATLGASYTAADNKEEAVIAVPVTAEYSFANAMTECDLSKEINNDKTIKWADIDEYVNGNLALNRGTAEDGSVFDALHTTNTATNNTSDHTIGAQGRITEVYKYTQPEIDDDGYLSGKTSTKWTFVYIDVLLGEVTKVVPATLDTNNHVMSKAELWIGVNDEIDGSGATVAYTGTKLSATDTIILKQDKNYTQSKGDKVLLTTYGLKGDTQVGDALTDAAEVNYAILSAVPTDTANAADFSETKDGEILFQVDFACDSVGESKTLNTVTLTVQGTTGLADDKTGIIADGKTYPTTWAYHVDHDGTVEDLNHTKAGTDVNTDTVLDDLCVNVTNSIIGQTYTAALDQFGNITGMWPSESDKIIGVVTDMDYARVSLGKYAVELEVFTTDNKTVTVRLLDELADTPHDYFPTQDAADLALKDDAAGALCATFDTTLGPKGALVELTSYTKDGATYWEVTDSCSVVTAATHYGDVDADDKVEPGKANTLVGTTHTADQVTDDTVFIVAEYDFDYSAGVENIGKNINVRYTAYKGFRNLPVITGDSGNIAFQMLDGKIKDSKAGYVLITAVDPDDKYTASKNPTILVDDSFLVIAPVATYAQYSEYLVAKNGKTEIIKVSNINGSVNEDLQNAIRCGASGDIGLLVATSENSQGYITAVDEVKDVTRWAENLGGHDNTVIEAGEGLTYANGVLAWDNGADSGDTPLTPDTYLTVAGDCIVKIVNVDKAELYDATLDSIAQYQATKNIVFELDVNGYVCCLYIID